jgi:hypothetical protein
MMKARGGTDLVGSGSGINKIKGYPFPGSPFDLLWCERGDLN